MSSRNRVRGNNHHQDADEERRLWKEIKDRAAEVDRMVARSNDIGREIIQVEAQQAAIVEAGKASSASLDDKLEKLYRENVKLCEDVQQMLEGGSNEMNLLDSIKILAGLREASEESLAASATGRERPSAATGRSGKAKRAASGGAKGGSAAAVAVAEDADEAASSAAPSPRISISAAAGRLAKEGKSSRAGSIPATRETSVKIEDGAESVGSSNDAAPAASTTASANPSTATKLAANTTSSTATGSRPSNRLVLKMGEIVFCRHAPHSTTTTTGKTPSAAATSAATTGTGTAPSTEPPEGEGILCRVTAVIGEGKQRRYEVQDADTSGEAPPPQRASVSQLIQIPESNRGLGELGKGRNVLAQYPDTTTFYKAVVSEGWRGGGAGEGLVRLEFEGDDAPREVERRFVLSEK